MLKRLPRPISLIRKGGSGCLRRTLAARHAHQTRKTASAKPGSREDGVPVMRAPSRITWGLFSLFAHFLKDRQRRFRGSFADRRRACQKEGPDRHLVVISSIAHLPYLSWVSGKCQVRRVGVSSSVCEERSKKGLGALFPRRSGLLACRRPLLQRTFDEQRI
jgi:hypothetical protein